MGLLGVRVLDGVVPVLIRLVDGYGEGRPAFWQRLLGTLLVVPFVQLWVFLDMRFRDD